jgi:hypothetical protein
MLPQETSVRQLKKLRAETKGTDIGDLTKDDRLNHNVPNLQYIGNPIDTGIESWQEFCQKDSSVQTIAFKSKLVNKPIVKENKTKNMNDIKMFEDFEDDFNDEEILQKYKKPDYEDRDIEPSYYEEYPDKNPTDLDNIDEIDRKDMIDLIYDYSQFEKEELENMSDEELENIYDDLEIGVGDHDEDLEESIKKFENFEKVKESRLDKNLYQDEEGRRHSRYDDLIIRKMEDEEQEFFERPLEGEIEEIDELETDDDIFNEDDIINDEEEFESIKTFEAFSVPAAKKEEKQPEYTLLGQEKEPKSNPNFGIGAVKAQEIKKISDFNLIDPPTPKERTIGGNAGVFIDNGTVKGFLNRIEGKDAYIESVDDPMVIKKFSIKDVVKTKKSE